MRPDLSRRLITNPVVTFVCLAISTGCVSQKKYNNAMDELAEANTDNMQLEAHNENLEAELAMMDAEVVELYDSLYEKDQALARARAEAWHLKRMERRLNRELAPMMASGEVVLERRDDELALVFKDKVFFETASDVIHTDGLNKLTEVAGVIRDTPNWDYEVEGHADSRPIDTPEYESNWELAADRAVAVVEFFTELNEVDPSQVSAVSYGDTKPEATNQTADGRQQNRRIEIALSPDLEELMDTQTISDMAETYDAVDED